MARPALVALLLTLSLRRCFVPSFPSPRESRVPRRAEAKSYDSSSFRGRLATTVKQLNKQAADDQLEYSKVLRVSKGVPPPIVFRVLNKLKNKTDVTNRFGYIQRALWNSSSSVVYKDPQFKRIHKRLWWLNDASRFDGKLDVGQIAQAAYGRRVGSVWNALRSLEERHSKEPLTNPTAWLCRALLHSPKKKLEPEEEVKLKKTISYMNRAGFNDSVTADMILDEAEYLDFPVAVGILTRAFKTRDQLKDPMAYLVQTMRKVREAAKKTEVTA